MPGVAGKGTGKSEGSRRTQFQKGDVKVGKGRPAPRVMAGVDMAADMRRAYTTDEEPGEPPGVKNARTLLKANYEKFMTLYARVAPPLAKVASDASEQGVLPKAGPKELRVAGVIDEMLREFGVRYRVEGESDATGEGSGEAGQAEEAAEGAVAAPGLGQAVRGVAAAAAQTQEAEAGD